MRGNANMKHAAATSRIPVSRNVWASLSSLRKPGETYNDLLEEMIEREKKRRLFEDMDRIEKRSKFVAMKW
jgi:predicted CopG family antitoxin